MTRASHLWRLIVIGGHTRAIGKTQLVCDIIAAFPETRWIAGKITQYGHGVCAQNGHDCDCAPDEHICAISWETSANTGTDSSRFLAAGAQRSFWLRTKQGFLAEGLPILRDELHKIYTAEKFDGDFRAAELSPAESQRAETPTAKLLPAGVSTAESLSAGLSTPRLSTAQSIAAADRPMSLSKPLALIVESNSLMQFVKPTLFFSVIAPGKEDFKDSARAALDRADALVVRGEGITAGQAPLWTKIPAKFLREKPSVSPAEGDPLPEPLEVMVRRALETAASVAI